MKSFFPNTFLIFILFFSCYCAFGQGKKLSYYDSLGVMPAFRFYLLNGNPFTPDSLLHKKTTVLIYIRTDCPFCEKEAEVISTNMNKFESINIIFITRSDSADVMHFAEDHKLENNNNVKFLLDKEKIYYNFYTASMIPSVHIYDRKKNLKLFTEGFISKDELLKYIH